MEVFMLLKIYKAAERRKNCPSVALGAPGGCPTPPARAAAVTRSSAASRCRRQRSAPGKELGGSRGDPAARALPE